jgi:hypothetical protein
MSQDTVTKRRGNGKVKIALLSIAALSFVGGAVSQTAVGRVSANTDQNNQSHYSSSWDRGRSNSSVDSALIVEAVEAYQATPPGGTTPVTTEASRVTKLAVFRDNAVGMVDSGDSGAHFFAHKVDGVWQIVWMGNGTPPADDMVNQLGMPREWTDPNFKF